MDSIFIFSREYNEGKFIQDLTLAGFNILALVNLRRYYFKADQYDSSEIIVQKNYCLESGKKNEEYIRFFTGNDAPVIEEYEGDKVYCLGSNDEGTDCEHLLLDWCIEYLKINPDHLIVSVDENVYTLEHLLKAKKKNEFYWMYKAPEELIR